MEATHPATACISIDHLSKSYGATHALSDLTIEVRTGEIFGFLGPNGAGKTTTIRLLLALQRQDSGTTSVFGLDSQRFGTEIHRRTGYLPGDLTLYPRLTGQQHFEWFARARSVSNAMTDELVERFKVVVDRPVKELSKGNRQKIGIVLAFMHRPELLILDEPTSGLDPLMQREFERLARETAASGRTVFLSSHELGEVQRLADRVAIIRDGRLVTLDTVDALRRAAPLRIEVVFEAPVEPSEFEALDGVQVKESHDRRIELEVTHALEPVLRKIAEHDPVDIVSGRADLDDVFMRLYTQTPQGEDGRGG